MIRLTRLAVAALGVFVAVVPDVRAEQPASGGAVPARMPVLIRNLWDLLWDNPRPLVRTGEFLHDWKWLAARFDKDGNAQIARDEFPANADMFERLDRNWDGRLTRQDFDWSEDTELGRQKETTFALFKSIDKSSEGRISPEEWQAAFAKAAADKGFLDDKDLDKLIHLPVMLRNQMVEKRFGSRSQSRATRLQNLLESGKLFTDGPEPGELAPDFALRSPDGGTKLQLSEFRGRKPVVLIFGSFT